MAAPMAPTFPTCPNCGAQATWHASHQQWGCDHCRQMLGPMPQDRARPPMPMPMQPPPSAITNPHDLKGSKGSSAGRVLGTLALIVLLVIIKLAIRGQL